MGMLALLSYVTELTEMHVKMFFGIEYECPRGHRFFCSSPDKVIKVTGAQMVKVSNTDIYVDPPIGWGLTLFY